MTQSQLYQPKPDLQLSKNIFKTGIEGLYYITFQKHEDNRGYFSELAKIPEIEEITGEKFSIKQSNLSSSHTNVVRGMHAEGWNKLITVITGTAFCALADIRPDSPTFSQTENFLFSMDSEEEGLNGGLFISAGIANSICVLKGPVNYVYGVDKLYQDRDPSGDKAISIFDPDLNIAWPIENETMILSERDRDTTTLREMFPEKF